MHNILCKEHNFQNNECNYSFLLQTNNLTCYKHDRCINNKYINIITLNNKIIQ